MKRLFFLILTLVFCTAILQAKTLTQTVRGTVIDGDTKSPIPGANVYVIESDPPLGAACDIDGVFSIQDVPVGRVSLRITAMGYEPVVLHNLLIESAKEMVLQIKLSESIEKLDEVTVTAKEDKREAINKMATISSKTFTVEETGRYAGALNDPARMVSAFAGVNTDAVGNNDIIVRGNTPRGILWRLEGIEIPNPNHFADEGTTGGPVSTLNASMLSNSDFFTGAFAPEYGNALSGVFDVRFRSGNNQKREYTASLSGIGTDATIEGPFHKNYSGSYLFNYRYSTLSLMDAIGIADFGGIPKYQDVSFKIDLSANGLGKFSIIGLGGKSSIAVEQLDEDTDDLIWSANMKAGLGILALKHNLILNKRSYLQSYVAATSSYNGTDTYWHFPDSASKRTVGENMFQRYWIKASVNHNIKFNAKNTLKTGFIYSQLFFDMDAAENYPQSGYLKYLDAKGNAGQIQAYTSWKHRFTKDLTMVAGLHYIQLFLENQNSIEPRVAFDWQMNSRWNFTYGFGLHSRLEPVSIYMASAPNQPSVQPNKDLQFTKSIHNVMGARYALTENLYVKSEIYYQHLFDVPVKDDTTSAFSALNMNYGYTADTLVNEGTGRNYGIELTLERYFANRFYFLLTGSLYESKYTALDGVERNSRYNAGFASNFLLGKEFIIKQNGKMHTLGVNLKVSYLGGNRYTPIDIDASTATGETQYVENSYFTRQGEDVFFVNLTASYRINRKRTTHEIRLEARNITNNQAVTVEYFDNRTGEIVKAKQLAFIPNIMYVIKF